VLEDRYELLERIGSGGMAEVWRARDPRLGREVAVKILAGPVTDDASLYRRIEREARALAAINHPNIVSVYDAGETEDANGDVRPFIVMELVEGTDLHRYLADHGPLELAEARTLMLGVLAGIERAHTSGVVHGDLKPANVFVGAQGPKVGDFGVARIMDRETGTTTVAATPTFAAPEVLRGERPTPSSDVYSAACLAFQMLTGHAPYGGSTGWEIARKHQDAPVPRVRELRSDVPAAWDDTLRRAMDKDPRRRFASASDMARALASVSAPEAGATVPIGADVASPPDRTEVLTQERPDIGRVALLGPLARLWDAAMHGSGSPRRAPGGSWRIRGYAIAASVIALLGASALFRDPGPKLVAVPDVIGRSIADANGELRTKGFGVDVAYRPVTQDEAGRVLETIPAPASMVEAKSDVHLIAGALAATPEPVVREEIPRTPERARGKHRHGKHGDD
jgi:serine/threonine-protein kinase